MENNLSQSILAYLKTISSYRATRKYQDIFKQEQKKLQEELVGQEISGDDYIHIFKYMIELKNEKIMHFTLDLIKVY